MTAAVVLAAGPGTRLGYLSARIPKAMTPVAGRPHLEHVATQLLDGGLRPIVVGVSHLGDQIRDHFTRWADVVCCDTQQHGTGADLIGCLDHVPIEEFVVWNGDTVVDIDLAALQTAWAQDPERGIVVLTQHAGVPNEGAFYVEDDGIIVASLEAVPQPAVPSTYAWRGASTGVLVLTKPLLARFASDPPSASLEKTILPALISARQLRAFDNGTRYFLDFGTPERLAQLHHDAASGAFPIR